MDIKISDFQNFKISIHEINIYEHHNFQTINIHENQNQFHENRTSIWPSAMPRHQDYMLLAMKVRDMCMHADPIYVYVCVISWELQ